MPGSFMDFVKGAAGVSKPSSASGPAPVLPAGMAPPSPPMAAPQPDPNQDNFEVSLCFTLKEEGGFVDNPADPGGATYKGITLVNFQDFFGVPTATAADLQNISTGMIEQFYLSYWNAVQCPVLALGVDLSVFDMAVNAGPVRSAKILQQSVGARQDGIIGPKTLALTNTFTGAVLIRRLYIEQLAFYKSLASYATFGRGWSNRCYARMNAALAALPTAGAPKAA